MALLKKLLKPTESSQNLPQSRALAPALTTVTLEALQKLDRWTIQFPHDHFLARLPRVARLSFSL